MSLFIVARVLIVWVLAAAASFAFYWVGSAEAREVSKYDLEYAQIQNFPNVLWVDATRDRQQHPIKIPLGEVIPLEKMGVAVREAVEAGRVVVIVCDPYCDASKRLARQFRDDLNYNEIYSLRGGTGSLE